MVAACALVLPLSLLPAAWSVAQAVVDPAPVY